MSSAAIPPFLALRRTPKLASEAVQAHLVELARAGLSLAQIQASLAASPPAGFGLKASREAIRRRLLRAGVALAARPFGLQAQTGESPAGARREISAAEIAKIGAARPRRPESWLQQFAAEIAELWDARYTYAAIWNILAAQYPMVPQLGEDLSDKAKSDRIADFVRRRRKQAARGRRRAELYAPASMPATDAMSLRAHAVEPAAAPRESAAPTIRTSAAAAAPGDAVQRTRASPVSAAPQFFAELDRVRVERADARFEAERRRHTDS